MPRLTPAKDVSPGPGLVFDRAHLLRLWFFLGRAYKRLDLGGVAGRSPRQRNGLFVAEAPFGGDEDPCGDLHNRHLHHDFRGLLPPGSSAFGSVRPHYGLYGGGKLLFFRRIRGAGPVPEKGIPQSSHRSAHVLHRSIPPGLLGRAPEVALFQLSIPFTKW